MDGPTPTPVTQSPPVSQASAAEATRRHPLSELLDELATILRAGIEEKRGAPVQRLTAALAVDADHRLTGLSGNADGQPPAPTAETFDHLGETLARLGDLGDEGRVAEVTLRIDGDVVSHEVTRTHD